MKWGLSIKSPKLLWPATACLVCVNNLSMVYTTQSSTTALMACLVWFGAFICIDDKFRTLRIEPQPFGILIGSVLILWALWRSHEVFHLDAVIFGLTVVQGIGLALFLVPLSRLREHLAPLGVLATLGVSLIVLVAVPIGPLSDLTARITQFILILFLQRPTVAGPEVWLEGHGVRIAGPCSGSETIAQLLAVSLIFVLAFPLKSRSWQVIMVLLTLPLAVLVNAIRIALLAFLNSRTWEDKHYWFDFFHEQSGSLVFSAIAVSIFGCMYLGLIEHQLRQRVT